MNFVPCTLEGQMRRDQRGHDSLSIPARQPSAAEAEGTLELGIRPMHMEVHSAAVDGGVPVTIKTMEDQGSFKILTMDLSGHALRARLPESIRFRKTGHG
jgi:glycerol transport system ATP-binding protein